MSVSVLPTRVAGFRVTRALSRDDRADLLLVRDEGAGALVAKVFRPGVERAGVDRELVALARGAHRHVLPLLDAECASDGAVVGILQHLPGGTLARWLEDRERVSAGEAVTVLAPLADAVQTLHGRGVAHGRLASSRVLFDSEGAPVLTGFGAAVLFSPDAPPVLRERVPEVGADLNALRRIADAVLGQVTGTGARRATELRAHLAGATTSEVSAVLVDGLFTFAAGSPVRFADPADDISSASEPARAPVATATREPAEPGRRLPSPGVPAGHPVAALLEGGPGPLAASLLRARWRSIDPGRRRVVVGIVAASTAAVVAMVLVPGGGGASSRADDGPGATIAPTPASPTRVAPTEGRASPGGARAGTPARSSPRSTAGSAGSEVRDPDPLVALPVLLRTRDRCLRDQDSRCLSAVDEPGSPAAAADAAAIDAGFAPPLSAAGARTIQSLGGVTIIDTGDPPVRIALVRRADGGWRLRDLPTATVG